MCLFTVQSKPLIAKEPIRAYKILIAHSASYISSIQKFNYTQFIKKNLLVKDKIPKIENEIELILRGIGRVNRGFHLYTRCPETLYYGNGIIFECEIPVGSYYFTNPYGTEICTNQFRFIKEI